MGIERSQETKLTARCSCGARLALGKDKGPGAAIDKINKAGWTYWSDQLMKCPACYRNNPGRNHLVVERSAR